MKLQELYAISNTKIAQGNGYADTIKRVDLDNFQGTKEFIEHYTVTYNQNSYYNTGIFTFEIRGKRPLLYGYKDGKPMFARNRKRLLEEAVHEVRIKPKTVIYNADELQQVDVDIFCTCNDFRYVFMYMAYKGFVKAPYNAIKTYGLVPVDKTDLKRYSDDSNHLSGREDAPIRNPFSQGALCKHSLLVIDRLMYDIDFNLIDSMQQDILDRNSTDVPTYFEVADNDNFKTDAQYYDRNGKLKNKSQIILARKSKIAQLKNIIYDLKFGVPSYFIKGGVTNFDALKTVIVGQLVEWDAYYINKAEIENELATKYLPDLYELDYIELADDIESLRYEIDFKNTVTDDTISSYLDSLDDKKKKDLDDLLAILSNPDFNLDDLLDNNNLLDSIFENKYIKSYNNYLHKNGNEFSGLRI